MGFIEAQISHDRDKAGHYTQTRIALDLRWAGGHGALRVSVSIQMHILGITNVSWTTLLRLLHTVKDRTLRCLPCHFIFEIAAAVGNAVR